MAAVVIAIAACTASRPVRADPFDETSTARAVPVAHEADIASAVTLISPEGKAIDVPAAEADLWRRRGFTDENGPARADRVTRETEQAKASPYTAIVGGVGRGLTLGTSDAIAGALGGDAARRELATAREAYPTLSLAGELGGAAALVLAILAAIRAFIRGLKRGAVVSKAARGRVAQELPVGAGSAQVPAPTPAAQDAVGEAVRSQPRVCPACPQCRAPTAWVAEYERFFCSRCDAYL